MTTLRSNQAGPGFTVRPAPPLATARRDGPICLVPSRSGNSLFHSPLAHSYPGSSHLHIGPYWPIPKSHPASKINIKVPNANPDRRSAALSPASTATAAAGGRGFGPPQTTGSGQPRDLSPPGATPSSSQASLPQTAVNSGRGSHAFCAGMMKHFDVS
jgi:hypothetical protein